MGGFADEADALQAFGWVGDSEGVPGDVVALVGSGLEGEGKCRVLGAGFEACEEFVPFLVGVGGEEVGEGLVEDLGSGVTRDAFAVWAELDDAAFWGDAENEFDVLLVSRRGGWLFCGHLPLPSPSRSDVFIGYGF